MTGIRLLIADDTTLMRRLLAQQLAQVPDFEVIGEASNGREAVEMAGRLHPDVVIMDLNMPGLNGLKATERIAAHYPYVKTILLTGFEDLASLGREAGASECLNKECTPEELAAAIRRAHLTRRTAPPPAMNGNNHQVAIERLATRGGLSDSEKMIMERVVTTDLTIHQIAIALSNERKKPITDSAIKHTLERVMTKLRLEPRTRSTLVKHVLAFNESMMTTEEEEENV